MYRGRYFRSTEVWITCIFVVMLDLIGFRIARKKARIFPVALLDGE